MLLKNELLLLNLTDFTFNLVLAIFFLAYASYLVIPPYYMALLLFFLSCYFFLCLAFLLFLNRLVFLFTYFSDSKLCLAFGVPIYPLQLVTGTLSSRTIASAPFF